MSEPDVGRQIRKALTGITDHYDASLEPVRRGPGSHVKASKEPPMPISAHVLDVRAMTRARLSGWCLVVMQDRELHPKGGISGLDVWGMVGFLDTHSDWLGSHEAGDVALDEFETSARELTHIAAPKARDWMSLGTCPLIFEVAGEPTPCMGTVRAYSDCDPYCDGCGTEAVVSWWERAMFNDPELTRLVTATELVLIVHKEFGKVIKTPTIRKWVERNIIEAAGQDEQGRTLFDRGSVAYALARWAVVA